MSAEINARIRGGGALSLLGSSPEEVLERLFEEEPGRRLRTMPGRETFHDAERGWVIKRTRTDEPRDWWFERLRPGGPRSPGRREAESLARLRAVGLAVPRPVLWVEEPAARTRAGGRSVVVMEHVPHATDLRRLLEAEPERAASFVEPLAALVSDLHRGGWYHRDLYLHHVLVDPEERLVLIDLARARQERAPRLRWFVKDLAALALWLPATVERRSVVRFLEIWEACSGVGPFSRRGRRRLLRAIERKRERLGAHAPRTPDSIAEPA